MMKKINKKNKKKAYIALLEMTDGTQKSHLINDGSEDNSLTPNIVCSSVLKNYKQDMANDELENPLIKEIKVFKVVDDYVIYPDLDKKYIDVKKEYDKNKAIQ